MWKYLMLFLVGWIPQQLVAQGNTFYHIDKITYKVKTSKDSVATVKNERKAITYFNMNGYNGVSLTETAKKRSGIHHYYTYAHRFKKIELQEVADKRPYTATSKDYFNTLLAINKRIKMLENNGFPFASLQIVDQQEKEDVLYLSYKVDSGYYTIIDKINLKSKSPLHEKTVLSALGLKPGDEYSEQKIRVIQEIITNDNNYSLIRPVEVLFREGTAELFIYLEKKKASSADGYVGFQQDRLTEKLVLNGYINLQLHNALNRAEIIDLNWRNSPTKTQDLKAKFEYPYLFGSPIGVGATLDLQKQDTSFVRSDVLLELIYRTPQFRVSIFDQIEQSSTISAVAIPGFRDYAKNTIGASIAYKPFLPDYLRFYHPKFEISGGVFNYRADTLDDAQNTSSNRKYRLAYSHKIDFLKYFHLNNHLSYQGLESSTELARNEFIYFGGLQSVRGFYELELSGKSIWVLQNEVEFKPFSQLALKVLYDYSTFANQQQNYTHSVGFGFGFINNNSQLDIIVATGKLNDNPLLLSDTKIHIGFKSTF